MNEKEMNAETASAETAEPEMVQVMARFTRAELDAMRVETGAVADATAVACFCRKNLRRI